jgi:hypothetical protein
MGYKLLNKCPVCNSKLKIVKLKCSGCGTIIENEFEQSKFDYLSKQQRDFVEAFIKCRGNIKDVEKELGISYPTVRAKLDDVIQVLGYSITKKTEVKTKKVLDMLENGEISAKEAVKMMNEN